MKRERMEGDESNTVGENNPSLSGFMVSAGHEYIRKPANPPKIVQADMHICSQKATLMKD